MKANQESKSDPNYKFQIQDRLIAASNQRCNLLKTLKRVSMYSNGLFGSLTTTLGAAGSIAFHADADTSRLLSGLAGVSSGTRAELNQAIFESVTTSVIIPGIEQERESFLTTIILPKRSATNATYTVEGAMADAIKYHGLCSIDTGINHAQKSIQIFDIVGIKNLKRYKKINTLNTKK